MSVERGAKTVRFNIDSRGNIFNISRINYAGIFSAAYYARYKRCRGSVRLTAHAKSQRNYRARVAKYRISIKSPVPVCRDIRFPGYARSCICVR